MNVSDASDILDTCAKIGMSHEAFLERDRIYLEHVNMLIYFTKAVIIRNGLQHFQTRGPFTQRAIAISQEFERLTFMSMPPDGNTALLDQFKVLDEDLEKLEEIRAAQGSESARRQMIWVHNWLESIFESGETADRLTLLYGVPLFYYIDGSIALLGKSVEAVVTGKAIE